MSKSLRPQKKATGLVQKPVLRVSVHLPGGQHLAEDATVTLSQKGKGRQLKRSKKQSLYETEVAPGEYTIEVVAPGWQGQKRPVSISSKQQTVSVYLGKRGWPYYRLAENVIPFEPAENILAVVFESRK